jgi:type III secretory pathway lipoprotein EscJ
MDQSVGDRPAIRSTLRLKAFLQTQQLIEKLNLLKSQKDLTVGAINELLAVILSTKIEIRKRNDDDAGTAVPASDNAAGVDDIRLTVEEMLGRF